MKTNSMIQPKLSMSVIYGFVAVLFLHTGISQEVKLQEEIIPITREVASLVDQFQSTDDVELKIKTIHQLVDKKKLAIPALPTLARALREEEVPKVRIAAAEAIGKIGTATPMTVKALIEGLNDTYDRVRAESAVSLAKLGPAASEAIPSLKEKTQKDDLYVRMNALYALGRIATNPDDVLDTLIAGLKDSNHQCRYSALMALNQYGEKAKSAVPALLEYGKKDEASMRTRLLFLKTLVSVGENDPKVLEWMIQQLNPASNPREVIPVLNLLGTLGPKARPAAPAIQELVDNARDSRVQAIAAQILKKIQSPAVE